MTETNVSLKKESSDAIFSFLTNQGFPSSAKIVEGLVSVVNQISDYHEEGVALYPDIIIISNESFFSTLADNHHIQICEEEINERSFSMAIKMCAPLAENGWNIYIQLQNDNIIKYGIVNAELAQMSVSLYDQVVNTPADVHLCAYIRNIGNKVVELISISNRCKISLNLSDFSANLDEYLQNLVSDIFCDVKPEYPIRNESESYIKSMIISALNSGHGNLIAVTDDVERIKAENHLQNGVFLSSVIDFAEMLYENSQKHVDLTATTLNAYSKLAISMLNFDGITLFNTQGCIVGYHFIVDNKLEGVNPIVGGSRSRAFEALSRTAGVKSCFMKSQDGKIKYSRR